MICRPSCFPVQWVDAADYVVAVREHLARDGDADGRVADCEEPDTRRVVEREL